MHNAAQTEPTTRSLPGHATVVLRVKDLETYDEQLSDVAVPVAVTGEQVRDRLIDAVASVHPTARHKSFEGVVASFVMSKYLVVARYIEPVDAVVQRSSAPDSRAQETLFKS